MGVKSLVKGLLVTAALTFTVVAAPVSTVRAEEPQGTYIVEKNDNLSKIAKKIYGNEKLWRVIYNANSDVVKSNYIIYKGQVLIIPAAGSNNEAVAGSTSAQTPTQGQPSTPAATGTPAPATTPAATETPAAEQEQVYTLDYNVIASWADGGFIGNDASGAPVVMALNATDDYAIIIFGDNSDMTAVSFIGPVTFSGEYATITDEANGMSLTFSVAEVGDGEIALDMGDIGYAVVGAATKESVLETIKIAIENYKHIA